MLYRPFLPFSIDSTVWFLVPQSDCKILDQILYWLCPLLKRDLLFHLSLNFDRNTINGLILGKILSCTSLWIIFIISDIYSPLTSLYILNIYSTWLMTPFRLVLWLINSPHHAWPYNISLTETYDTFSIISLIELMTPFRLFLC